MKKLNWCGYDWTTQQRWGEIHPDQTWQYFGGGGVRINSDGHLEIETIAVPKSFDIEGELIVSHIDSGMVNSVNDFGYGRYIIEAKLPKGCHLWNAFWMYAVNDSNNYAEVDVFEGYTNDRGSYCKFDWRRPFSLWAVRTNFHHSIDDPELITEGAKNGLISFKNPSEHFIKYEMEYNKDFIKIYHDDKLVRKLEGDIMNSFSNHQFQVIIGAGVQQSASLLDIDNSGPMVIKSFTYLK